MEQQPAEAHSGADEASADEDAVQPPPSPTPHPTGSGGDASRDAKARSLANLVPGRTAGKSWETERVKRRMKTTQDRITRDVSPANRLLCSSL
jgi:hypothetical protein